MNRRKTTGIVASAALAVVGALILIMFVKGRGATNTASDATATTVPTRKVWVVKTDIGKGVPIEQIRGAQAIEQKDLPITDVIPGADGFDANALTNKITAQAIFAGEQLIEVKFQSIEDSVDQDITPGHVALSLILPAERMAGIGLVPNETIGILGSFAQSPQYGDVTHHAFHKVRIIGKPVPWGAVAAPVASAPPTEGQAINTVPAAQFTGQMQVTLSVSAPDAERLVFLNQFGTLHLLREPASAKEDGTKLVVEQNIYEVTGGSQDPALRAAAGTSTTVAGAPTTKAGAAGSATPTTTIAPAAAGVVLPAPTTTK